MKHKKEFPTGSGRDNVLVIYPVKNKKGTYRFKRLIVHKDYLKQAIEKVTRESTTSK